MDGGLAEPAGEEAGGEHRLCDEGLERVALGAQRRQPLQAEAHALKVHDGLRGVRRAGSGADSTADTASTAGMPSVATSAVTLQSTFHSRQRSQERNLGRRQLQSAVKHGTATVTRDGRLKIVHEGTTVVTDAAAKKAVTAWDERSFRNTEGSWRRDKK